MLDLCGLVNIILYGNPLGWIFRYSVDFLITGSIDRLKELDLPPV